MSSKYKKRVPQSFVVRKIDWDGQEGENIQALAADVMDFAKMLASETLDSGWVYKSGLRQSILEGCRDAATLSLVYLCDGDGIKLRPVFADDSVRDYRESNGDPWARAKAIYTLARAFEIDGKGYRVGAYRGQDIALLARDAFAACNWFCPGLYVETYREKNGGKR